MICNSGLIFPISMNSNDHELVFGLVYPIGTDADPVVGVLQDYLRQMRYELHDFRISQHLRTLDLGIRYDDSSPSAEIDALIRAGNKARRITKKNEILAVAAINDILASRPIVKKLKQPTPGVAYVVRSFKRKEEVKLFRSVYRPGFFLIGIANDDDKQEDYLVERKGLSPEDARALIRRDQNEQLEYGQRTRDTFYLADVFVQLEGEKYKEQLRGFLDCGAETASI